MLVLSLIKDAGVALLAIVRSVWKFRHERKQKRQLAFYQDWEIENATRYFVDTHWQTIPPSKEYEIRGTLEHNTRERTVPYFLKVFNKKNSRNKYFLLLADSGMGKTTFLINLFYKYTSKLNPKYSIELFPLAFQGIDKSIEKVENKANTILLLDALDEDVEAIKDYEIRLKTLFDITSQFKFIIITSRTQFFPSEIEEPKKTTARKFTDGGGYYKFKKMYISPFSDKDINQYLNKRFPFWQFWTLPKKKRAREIVKKSPNLMVRPMLLSNIEDLLVGNKQYERTCQIYEELIERWLEREAKWKYDNNEQYKEHLYRFSKELAKDLYFNRIERKGLFIEGTEIIHFATKHNIILEELEMKSRSLLNRNTVGQYKFSHKSILEYLLALEAYNDKGFKDILTFEGLNFAKVFLDELTFGNEYIIKDIKQEKIIGVTGFSNDDFKLLSDIEVIDIGRMNFLGIADFENIHLLHMFTDVRTKRNFNNKFKLMVVSHDNIERQKYLVKRIFGYISIRDVYFIEAPIAAALGMGIDLEEPEGNLVVEIGLRSTSIGVTSLKNIVLKRSVNVGWNSFVSEVMEHIRRTFKTQINEEQAQHILMNYDSDFFNQDGVEIHLNGNNTNIESVAVPLEGVQNAIKYSLREIELGIWHLLENMPPEISVDVYRTGFYICGIGSNISGLDRYFSRKFKLQVHHADDPQHCCTRGIVAAFKQLGAYTLTFDS